MIVFIIVLLGLVAVTLLIQLISNMKIVGGNELGLLSGGHGKKRFITISGGRIFSIPLLNRFAKMNLTPYTIEVQVDSAIAEKERLILRAKQEAAVLLGNAQGEIDELKKTIEILRHSDEAGKRTYLIEHFRSLIEPFAETLDFFPATKLTVITGVEGNHQPISAVHPHAVEAEKNSMIQGALQEALQAAGNGLHGAEPN